MQEIGKATRLFCWHQNFLYKRLSAPAPGLYTYEKILKMCIQAEFKEICLKLATNGRSNKGFLLTSKVCPQGVFFPCPGAIYMYKIIKNVEEIILKLATYGQGEKGLSVVIKFLSPLGCLPLSGAIYYEKKKKKKKKTVKNQTLKTFVSAYLHFLATLIRRAKVILCITRHFRIN